MDSITIRKITFKELESAPNFQSLLDEYGAESSIPEIGAPAMQKELYQRMEDIGLLRFLGAFRDGELVGAISVIVSVLPHYGKSVANTESFFVLKSERKTGAGIALLRAAEKEATALGAEALLVSSPFGGRLSNVLPHSGYRQSNQVFVRSLT